MPLRGVGVLIPHLIPLTHACVHKYCDYLLTMTTRLQVHLSAKSLKNLGGLLSGVSNPFAVITVRGDSPDNAPHVLGQTDV